LLGFLEKPNAVPSSISESVLKGGGSGTPVGAAAARKRSNADLIRSNLNQ